MKAPNITPGDWMVMADPEHAGKHPAHDSRFVATTDADLWRSDDNKNWHLTAGSLIASTRNGEHQAANARAIAAVPDLLAALEQAAVFMGDTSKPAPMSAAMAALKKAGYTL